MLTDALRASTVWTVTEYRRKGGRIIPTVVLRRKNLHTNTGLTAFAGAFQGSYLAPTYMVIGGVTGKIQNAGTLAAASTSVQSDVAVDIAGDTQLLLGVGSANQETVTFSGRSGAGPYTYTIAATTKTHTHLDLVTRVPLVTDTLAQVQSEVQYDSVNNPNQRMASLGGYSGGTGNWVMQFFFNANQALINFGLLGLADTPTVGTGNLHNHLALGYAHLAGYDAEIDVSLTLANA